MNLEIKEATNDNEDNPYFLDTVEKLQSHIKEHPEGFAARTVRGFEDELRNDIENSIIQSLMEKEKKNEFRN